MIGSGAFNYINILDKAADASWARNTVLTNNIANVDTPNYKRKDVQFESYLMAALAGGETLDQRVGEADLFALNSTTYTDHSLSSYRMDGNNVDIDTEEAEFAKNQLRYYTLNDSLTQEFSRIKSVLNVT